MNTINARLLVNEFQHISLKDATPAELLLLREIHAPSLAAQALRATNEAEQTACWGFIQNPIASGVAMQGMEADPDDDEATEPTERTDAQEAARLRGKYLVRAKSGAQGSHIMDDLFPGRNPELPATFEEIGLKVAAPKDEKPAKKAKDKTKTPAAAVAGNE